MLDMQVSFRDIRSFAKNKHAEKNQLYAGQPYEYHLERVEEKLIFYGYDSAAYRAAAWLHDTVEDTDTTVAEIMNVFGEAVARLVWAVTGVGPNRKIRNQSIYQKLGDYPAACPLKVADRLVNHETTMHDPALNGPSIKHLSMYLSERAEFEKAVKGHVHHKMWTALQKQYEEMDTSLNNSR
jgi:Guanosine polyphosphate pyrophosphohydrolases/synthetases